MSDRKENVEEAMERHLRLFKTPPQREMDLTEERILNRLHSTPAGVVEEKEAQARSSWKWNRIVFAFATAAVVLLAFLVVPSFIHRVDASATVESGDGKLLQAGQRIDAGKIVSANGTGAMLLLADGSHVEMRAGAALLLERADDGVRVRLANGDVIVNAGKQRSGHLYVQTKDVTASVVGTVFFVNAEEEGSRVAVIEGEVRVQKGSLGKSLQPGEQAMSSRSMEPRLLTEEISWSRNAPAHIASLQQPPKSSRAARTGSLSGVIRTTDGEPARGVRVSAMSTDSTDLTFQAVASLGQTDEAGRFFLENIPPGTYYIAAGRYTAPTFYPGTLEVVKGAVVAISSAATVSGMDFIMNDVSAVSRGDAPPTPQSLYLAHADHSPRLKILLARKAVPRLLADATLRSRLGLTRDQEVRIADIALKYDNDAKGLLGAQLEALNARKVSEIFETLTESQKDQLELEASRDQDSLSEPYFRPSRDRRSPPTGQ
jgi:ferric-dicitrate binding protein FerR (iron transport regulator)